MLISRKQSDCETCQSVRNMPAETSLHPWVWPTRIWQRVHVDFAENDKQMFLVMHTRNGWKCFHWRPQLPQRQSNVLGLVSPHI